MPMIRPDIRRFGATAAALGLVALGVWYFAGPALAQIWGGILVDIQAAQRDLHGELAGAIRAVQSHGVAAAWTLVTLSFLYGVFHAAGPGHGKFVISTYLVTHEDRLRRGIAISFLSSLMQGLTAIVAVEAVVSVFHLQFRDAQSATVHLETASYALVLLLGLFLVYANARRLWARLVSKSPGGRDHGQGAGHAAGHDHGETCGHAHGPSAEEIAVSGSLRHTAAIVLSVGIRPCSGAILVLLLAHVAGLHWAGIVSVVAMSVGTGLAIAALAALSVYARRTMRRLAERTPGTGAGRVAAAFDGLALAGGLAVVAIGASLLQGALSAPVHPLL